MSMRFIGQHPLIRRLRRLGDDIQPRRRVRRVAERVDPRAVERGLAASVELVDEGGLRMDPDRGAPVADARIVAPREVEALAAPQLAADDELQVPEHAVLEVDLDRPLVDELAHTGAPPRRPSFNGPRSRTPTPRP